MIIKQEVMERLWKQGSLEKGKGDLKVETAISLTLQKVEEKIDEHLEKWVNKWIGKRVLGRSIVELKKLKLAIKDDKEKK